MRDQNQKTAGTRFVFITGGVTSSLGKGLAAASLAEILKARGLSVRLRKMDPYLNIDPGTMSPEQHGEVYVTEDGTEADLDLGHYERFTGDETTCLDSTSTGKIMRSILEKERRGDYLGSTVQIIPHVTDAIKAFIENETQDIDIVICEIGGTVGDIEGLPFLEAIRQCRQDKGHERTLFLHVALVLYIETAGECKTKPAQHSVKELQRSGIQPDILLCRSDRMLSEAILKKLALFCNVPLDRVIEGRNVETIYRAPLSYHQAGLDQAVCSYFGLTPPAPQLNKWASFVAKLGTASHVVTIGIVAKYPPQSDAYKSLIQAVTHSAASCNVKAEIRWIDAADFDEPASHKALFEILGTVQGILIPGGFGKRGTEGKIAAIRFAREQGIPTLGICLAMQLMVVEAARNLLNLDAGSTEFGAWGDPVVGLLTEWISEGEKRRYEGERGLGGTMRLGRYPCKLKQDSLVSSIYEQPLIEERHRHRYEVNMTYQDRLEEKGLIFSGLSPDGLLPEIVEHRDHPWMVGVQFHPEFRSNPFAPHPLMTAFIARAAKEATLSSKAVAAR